MCTYFLPVSFLAFSHLLLRLEKSEGGRGLHLIFLAWVEGGKKACFCEMDRGRGGAIEVRKLVNE